MRKLVFIATMVLFSFQLQADTLSRRDAAKKEFLDASQEELSKQSQAKKIKSNEDSLLSLDKKPPMVAIVTQQVEKTKLKPDTTDDQHNTLDTLSSYSDIFRSKMRNILVAIGLQEHEKSEKITHEIVLQH